MGSFSHPKATEPSTICTAGGLDLTAIGGKGGVQSTPIVVGNTVEPRTHAIVYSLVEHPVWKTQSKPDHSLISICLPRSNDPDANCNSIRRLN